MLFRSVRIAQRMSNSEGFVEAMAGHKVKNIFGIVGSAFMDALDIFPAAGIRFLPCQHEQSAAHMADGYARVSGKHGVLVNQNGPGVTNAVTGVAAAYWAHSPVVNITPECATASKGHGGFQELDTIPVFSAISKAQFHVNNPNRIVEMTERAFDTAMQESGPTQLNIPRDFFYGEGDYSIRGPRSVSLGAGSEEAVGQVLQLLKTAKNPYLLCGAGVNIANARNLAVQLSDKLALPVCTTYLHNDAFPCDHPHYLGPLGYLGSKAAMRGIAEADLVLAVGCRMNPFGTLPQYGMDYWPKDAKIVQVDKDLRRLGLTKACDVEVHADARAFLQRLMQETEGRSNESGVTRCAELRTAWHAERDAMTEELNAHQPEGESKMKPRKVLDAIRRTLPGDSIVSTDIGNSCSVANGYLEFPEGAGRFLSPGMFGNCGISLPVVMGAKVASQEAGKPQPCVAISGDGAWGMQFMELLTCVREDIPVTAFVFNNRQWGAEKKNQVLWFGDRYVGSNLENPSFAEIAKAMGCNGIIVEKVEDVEGALAEALRLQMEEGKTCVVELMTSRELGPPFRRDAMKLPQRLLPKYQAFMSATESVTEQPTDR